MRKTKYTITNAAREDLNTAFDHNHASLYLSGDFCKKLQADTDVGAIANWQLLPK